MIWLLLLLLLSFLGSRGSMDSVASSRTFDQCVVLNHNRSESRWLIQKLSLKMSIKFCIIPLQHEDIIGLGYMFQEFGLVGHFCPVWVRIKLIAFKKWLKWYWKFFMLKRFRAREDQWVRAYVWEMLISGSVSGHYRTVKFYLENCSNKFN